MAGDTIKFLIEMRDGASAPLKKVGKAADQSGKDAKTATTKYTELSSKLHLVGMAAKAAQTAVLAIVKPMKMLAVGGVEAGAQMEGFETRLKVLMGSSGAAKERLDELFEIGSTTPFQLPGLMEAEVNLRALGVNAEETLPLVMDFAGAMKVDVARAAVEVGRAMQFGAGAVETIAGRSLRAQVELKTGADALKMSTEEFREAMVATLTDEDGIFKGGTEELAKTFDGMVSNLEDSWFKFQKDIADAGAFQVAKEILSSVLKILSDSQDTTARWAEILANSIVKSMVLMLSIMGRIFETAQEFRKAFMLIGVVMDQMVIKSSQIDRSIKQAILSAGKFTGLMSDATREDLERRIVYTYKDQGDARERIKEAMFGELKILEQEEAQIRKIRKESERISSNLEAIIAGPQRDKGRPRTPPQQQQKGGATGPTAEELEDSLKASLEATESHLRDATALLLDLQYKLSPAGLAESLVSKLTDPFTALTSMMGPAGGLVQGLAAIGQMGTDQIVDNLKSSIKGVVKAIFEVVPELIVQLPRVLVETLVMSLFKAFEKLLEKIRAIFQPRKQQRDAKREERLRKADRLGLKGGENMRALGAQFLEAVMPKKMRKLHTGTSHVDRTGAFFLQAGEAIVPNSGTTTQGMERRMGGGGGVNVTINTNVVDRNAIRGLGKLLEQEFSSFGRSTSPLFNSPTGTRG